MFYNDQSGQYYDPTMPGLESSGVVPSLSDELMQDFENENPRVRAKRLGLPIVNAFDV